jgi:chromate reductase
MLVKEAGVSGTGGVRFLGISGSGRAGSYNTALLKAAKKALPDGVTLEIFDVSHFPLYNEDLEAEAPEEIREFKKAVKRADAVLFAAPEYNYSVSAVLKNAVEWGNRPDGDNSWYGKPAEILSASTSQRGGARAQLHLRQIMVDLNMHPLNQPQFLMGGAGEKFDGELRLTDERYRKQLGELLNALLGWTTKLRVNLAVARQSAT